MGQGRSVQAYSSEVWSAVGHLWPPLGEDPAAVVGPYIPVLPAFFSEAHSNGRTAESAALEIVTFFLDLYLRNALSEEERKARLVDLYELSKRPFEQSRHVDVLPFTAALVSAQQIALSWSSEGKVGQDEAKALNREVLCALLGRSSGTVPRLGWLTLEAAGKK
ncbi:MAG TPA: hypothetical protein VLQ79_06875 [Myxococcaceae bacterium]|nr:hypothetical protein [Myxococcaceae bacterium]